jgi:hypothetical protein
MATSVNGLAHQFVVLTRYYTGYNHETLEPASKGTEHARSNVATTSS